MLPEQWVTLQQVYQCAIDPDLFAAKIKQAEAWSAELNTGEVFIPVEKWDEKMVEVVGMGVDGDGRGAMKHGPHGARNWSRN